MAQLRENKISKVMRVVLSFVLFVLIVITSVSACAKAVFLDKNSIENRFASYDYISAVKKSAMEYAADIYMKNGLDCSSLDKIFEDELIKESVKAYISNNIGIGAGYNESTYLEPIENICSMLEKDIKHQTGKNNRDDSTAAIIDLVESYLIGEIDISIPKAKVIMNSGNIAAVAVLCVSLFFTISVLLILAFIGDKRYRSLRAISISFYTAGLFEMIISIAACAVFRIKHIDIFPLYLKEVVMGHIYSCIGSVAFSGGIMLFAALIISTIVWKIRREK